MPDETSRLCLFLAIDQAMRWMQRAIGSTTPIQALNEWQRRKLELFVRRVYYQTGLDSYIRSLPVGL
ncbi:hypothetical protein ACFOLJ_20100 [Rugamonas sp. CCM 8940]|uniref:hypothetical protein n=1 Tax=Rugamonas sp. CCM 8940 TaxID=2765359 RepID=UPI0018F6E2C1|nr:hypothetical protein [Rugamonas sp. CCM 8940]